MTDAELADGLNIPVDIVPKIAPKKRVVYERLLDLSVELCLWQAGLQPRPTGVIVCMPHKRVRRGAKKNYD